MVDEALIVLQGTGPWTLEAQIVGPKGSEIVRIPKVSNSRHTLNLPIPKDVDREGGSFEIDLGESTVRTKQLS